MLEIHDAITSVEHPDELSFVDEDIRELFKDCNYVMGMPLLVQLIKELRLLRESLKGEPWKRVT